MKLFSSAVSKLKDSTGLDLGEFASQLRDDTREIGKDVQNVSDNLHLSKHLATASKLTETVAKHTASLISAGDAAGEASAAGRDGTAAAGAGAAFSRREERLRVLRSDAQTFTAEPPDADVFAAWSADFNLLDRSSEIQALLRESPELHGLHGQLVPQKMPYRTFWERYFYRVHRMDADEARRAAAMQRAAAPQPLDESLSLDWGDGDDDATPATMAGAEGARGVGGDVGRVSDTRQPPELAQAEAEAEGWDAAPRTNAGAHKPPPRLPGWMGTPSAGAKPSAESGAQPSAESGAKPSAESGAKPSAESGAPAAAPAPGSLHALQGRASGADMACVDGAAPSSCQAAAAQCAGAASSAGAGGSGAACHSEGGSSREGQGVEENRKAGGTEGRVARASQGAAAEGPSADPAAGGAGGEDSAADTPPGPRGGPRHGEAPPPPLAAARAAVGGREGHRPSEEPVGALSSGNSSPVGVSGAQPAAGGQSHGSDGGHGSAADSAAAMASADVVSMSSVGASSLSYQFVGTSEAGSEGVGFERDGSASEPPASAVDSDDAQGAGTFAPTLAAHHVDPITENPRESGSGLGAAALDSTAGPGGGADEDDWGDWE